MISLRNIFCKSNPAIVKLSLALRTAIGSISTAVFLNDKPALAFYLLVAGAAIDFFLQMLPENAKTPEGTKTLFLIGWLIAAATLLSGCKIIRPATDSSLIDTTTVNYKKVNVEVKGAKVNQVINYDSLLVVWKAKYKQYQLDSTLAVQKGKPLPARPEPTKQTLTDPGTKAQLTYWIDEFGKLQVGCESKDQTIQMLVAETNRLPTSVWLIIKRPFGTGF
jgi:hypothetical protein